MSNCEKCKCSNIIESKDGYYCSNCGWDSHNNQYKKVTTNADRIRQMTDEKLAQFLLNFKNTFGEEYEGVMSCLEWLKEEVEEENG